MFDPSPFPSHCIDLPPGHPYMLYNYQTVSDNTDQANFRLLQIFRNICYIEAGSNRGWVLKTCFENDNTTTIETETHIQLSIQNICVTLVCITFSQISCHHQLQHFSAAQSTVKTRLTGTYTLQSLACHTLFWEIRALWLMRLLSWSNLQLALITLLAIYDCQHMVKITQ